MNQLVIDGYIRSYDDLNLLIEKRDLIPLTRENKTFYSVLANDAKFVEKHKTYKEKSFSITFHVYNNNLSEYLRLITEIFLNAKTIHFTDDDTVFYKILDIESDGIKLDGATWGKMDVKFTIMPYAYVRTNIKTYIDFSKKIELIKEGTAIAKPKLLIFGTGDIQLLINGKYINIKELPFDTKPLLIDSEVFHSSFGFQNGTPFWRGDYPIFDKKINTIELLSGNLKKIEITPRWAYL